MRPSIRRRQSPGAGLSVMSEFRRARQKSSGVKIVYVFELIDIFSTCYEHAFFEQKPPNP